jgi:hypothetical protein
MRIKINQRGNALFLTMIMLSGILIVVLGVSNIIMPGIVMNRGKEHSVKAYFAAEAGMEKAVFTIFKGSPDFSGYETDQEPYLTMYGSPVDSLDPWYNEDLPNGSQYNLAWASTTVNMYIISTGSYQDSKRKVQAMIKK